MIHRFLLLLEKIDIFFIFLEILEGKILEFDQNKALLSFEITH